LTFIVVLRTSSIAPVTGTSAHLTVKIIDDAARKPSDEKAGEKPLFSARPLRAALRTNMHTVGFFDSLKHCIYQGFDFKREINLGTILANNQA
jgi:hypothetical protein